jgi:hypothetical protein
MVLNKTGKIKWIQNFKKQLINSNRTKACGLITDIRLTSTPQTSMQKSTPCQTAIHHIRSRVTKAKCLRSIAHRIHPSKNLQKRRLKFNPIFAGGAQMSNTKQRSEQLQALAAKILAASGADVSKQVDIYSLAKVMQKKCDAHFETCKRHITKAVLRSRFEYVAPRRGGFRDGAGRKAKAQPNKA